MSVTLAQPNRGVGRLRGWLPGATAACAVAILVADALEQPLQFVRVRVLIEASVALAAACAVASRGKMRAIPRLLAACGIMATVEIVVIAVPLILDARQPKDVLFAGHALVAMLVGWALVLGVTRDGTDHHLPPPPRNGTAIVLLALAVVAGLAMWSGYVSEGRPVIVDEMLYRLQSRLVSHQGSALPLLPGLERFFMLRMAFVSPHGLVPQYPPGWPWLLAGFRQVRLETLAPALCAGLTVVATGALARRVVGPTAALAAALLLVASPEFLLDASFHFAHAATALALVLGALSGVPRAHDRPESHWRMVGAGACVGIAILLRPLTGAMVGASIALWATMRTPVAGRRFAERVPFWVAGSLPFVAVMLWYQHHTTGHLLLTGYAAANDGLHDLGFGVRGFLSPKGTGIPHAIVTYFGWRAALIALAKRLWDAGLGATAGAPLAPLVAMASAVRPYPVIRWSRVAAFLPLPVAHFFFFYTDPRFYCEMLPFLAIGIAFLIDRLWIDGARRWRLLAATVTAAVAIHAVRGLEYRRVTAGMRPLYDAAKQLSDRCGPLLVFAADSAADGAAEPTFETLYWFDIEGFRGRVLAARDLGALDSLLLARNPGRLALTARLTTPGFFRPLQPSATRPPRCDLGPSGVSAGRAAP